MKITNLKAMRNFIYENSGFSKSTVNNVIYALGIRSTVQKQPLYIPAEKLHMSGKLAPHVYENRSRSPRLRSTPKTWLLSGIV
jgi:hypothetical protein